ncbi:glycoside hydrolase family 30 protein [Serpula lacrymans var. lacrymans S7.3]|uniref:Glycoside hydrolase family 30 protein n=2 Tax=Serpula lacrymans var. lacrymans TaxID=341189 RepID=F8Q357_SERL3|nr:glycoside hydrolase family 30 protein [Serpula lacrymans var. lacrymans S7.9]EGN97618.1 glycoside hydrolase family 30 protein [Serpula lacrymans var. lacrymans S7.3]EGO23210.1 glycoside hydrolase family 30 protein [Serpula lacrymans var. lacrymans S7.9]
MRSIAFIAPLAILQGAAAQQIYDIWQTTWDRSNLFTYFQPTPDPIDFVTPGAAASADISVDDSSVYQTIYGFGASLTDSSAQLLSNLKTQNSANYWELMDYLFNVTDGANAAGFSYIRVPLGASDFSASLYSLDDTSGDTSLGSFNIDAAPSYVFSTLTDILSINNRLSVHILPWSPPGWMKSGSTMDGGTLDSQYVDTMANYLLKSLQGFQSKNIPVYALSIQNEPENSNPTYPSCSMPVAQEAAIGTALRSLMNSNGFTSTKLIGYEHNWSDAANYPVQLMQQAGSSFDGVSFHCYEGAVSDMSSFTSQYPSKEVYLTECTGTIGSDWWSDIKWYMDNLFIVGPQYGASNGLMWNLALDGNGDPILSGTNSCASPGCRGVAQINSDGSYSLNQEFYSMAQASKAIIPKDVGGPFGQRIGVSVSGSLSWSLIVGAYVTGRVSSTDWNRYAIVVLNWDDSSTTTWNPVPVEATIEFRGMQATYTFPVGVTTLWWYAAPN